MAPADGDRSPDIHHVSAEKSQKNQRDRKRPESN
jgi:hypothetical protein